MQYQRIACGFLRKLFVILLVCIPAFAFAQENGKESPFYASADITSKYIWRGMGNGDAPAVMPTVGFSKGGFDVYVWGAYALDDSYREMNIGVSYSFSNFTVELVDYFYPGKGSDFFNFSNSTTTHSVEAIVTYEPEAVPVYLTLGSTIYGDDKKENGNNAFSTYAEVGYNHEFNGRNYATVGVGAALNKGFYTDYEKGFSVVNLTAGYTHILKLGNFTLPISGTCSYNPYLEKFYWAVSLNFGIFNM